MTIGIDGNEANVQRRVGISEFAYQLLVHFAAFKKNKIESDFLVYLKHKPIDTMPTDVAGFDYRVVTPRPLWTQIGLPFDLLTRKKIDVFFSPTHYAPRFSPVPTVVSVMDLSYLHFPYLFKKRDLYQLKNWTAYSVKHASKVITISKSSKNDIIDHYRVPENNVVVVYPGIKPIDHIKMNTHVSDGVKKKYNIENDYILFVGTLQPRKNITRLIEAFAEIKKKKKDLDLVIVGKKGWLYEEILEAPKKFGVDENIKFLEFVPNEDLPSLYGNAICFVLPSLYEGFGLPVLEAMNYGCPVVTSNISSLPEAGGDAAEYCDPENIDSIRSVLEKVIEDKSLRSSMIEKGYKQVEKFSWEKTADTVLKVLESVGKNER